MSGIYASFSSRIAGYFAALFLAALGVFFSLWYFGLPLLELSGASNQRLAEAMRTLELKADLHRTLIASGLRERRGDMLVVAENVVLAGQLANNSPEAQLTTQRVFERLQRAYPDRYLRMLVVNPVSKQIVASSDPADVGKAFQDPVLIQRATQSGVTEMIEQMVRNDAPASLAVVRQIHTPDADGFSNGKLVGILIGLVDLQQLVTLGFSDESLALGKRASTLLFDSDAQALVHVSSDTLDSRSFTLDRKVAPGFEGTLTYADAGGMEWVAVYRYLQLSGSQGWTVVNYLSKSDALGALKGDVSALVVAGLILAGMALLLISLAARRVTRPLLSLAQTATKLGGGDLSIRAMVRPKESREIAALSDAFNGMAAGIQRAHQTLEDRVLERTTELARERDRVQGYLDIAGIMLMALDTDGRISMINKKGAEVLGQAESGLVGMDWFENFVPAGERHMVRQVFRQIMAGDLLPVAHFENRVVNSMGQELIMAWNNTLLRDPSGAVAGTLSSAEDVTERKRAQERLRQSEENLAITLQSIGDAVIATDAQGRITRMNPTAERLTGWPLADAAGRLLPEVFEIVNAQTRVPSVNPVQLVMDRGEVVGLANHTALIARDGREHQISDSAAPIRDAGGLIVGVVLVFSDVTEDYRVRAALESTAELLERTGEIAQIGGWELDLKTMVHFWSPQTCRILEVDPPVAPSLEQGINFYAPEVRPVIRAAVQAAMDFGTPYDLELPAFTALGRSIWVRAQGSAVMEDGKAIKLLGALHDITQRKQAELYEQFRSRILELLAGGEALPSLLEALVRGVERLNPAMLCSILLLDNEARHLGKGIAPSLPDFYNAALDGAEIGLGVGSCGTAAFTGERVVVEDIATHPYWVAYKELAARAGLGACWSQPIKSSSGAVLGTFAIYHREQHIPADSDIVLIEQTAHLASIAIERGVAAQKLRDSEAHFRLLTEDASDVVWKQDRNNRFTYMSPADERMRGFSVDEVLGHHVFELLTEEGIALVQERLSQKRSADAPGSETASTTFELQQRCKDGSLIWTEVVTKPDRDPNGVLIGYHGITREITKRRQAEEAQRIAATAFESQEGMFVTDTSSVILRVNKTFTEITGYTAQEAVGQNPRLFKSGRHEKRFYEDLWRSIEQRGSWQGEIWNRRKDGEVFPEWLTITAVKDNAGLTTHYVATFTDISARKVAEEQIKRLAFYDPLTGLPNRRLLMDRLEQALAAGARHQRKGALLFVDLDNFKVLNDTLGHYQGDLLLEQVAQRLSTCIREGDTVARLGGDEFVVMLEDLSENAPEAATQAEIVGEKILATLNQIYQLGAHEHRSTPSIGITLFGEQHEDIDQPLKRADLAMYQAKAAGRNTLRFFDPQMQAVVSVRAALESSLREAVQKKQFILHYQAQVTGQASGPSVLTGAEALVRWHDPSRGLVSPAEFIPLAEETGLILPLGAWVLETACTQLARWAGRPDMAPLTLAVNVSARQFHQANFVDQVLAVLARTGANPSRLKLELTEGLLVANVEDIIAKMTALKAVGVGFSLDDFGTGYSSLSYLKRLPLDQLKIDQGFVRDILIDPNDAAIAKMVVVLANSLGLAVIAEGVETGAQREFLAGQGCYAYQGYLFGRPMPLEEFEAMVLQA